MSLQQDLTSSKSWRTLRSQLGEKNATGSSLDAGQETGDFFDVARPRLKFPQEMEARPTPISYPSGDPFQHMGRIGYTHNTYQFRGAGKEENNIYGSQHMKTSCWFEEMRRRIYAEEGGIDAHIDASNVAGTAAIYYKNSKNKYYNNR